MRERKPIRVLLKGGPKNGESISIWEPVRVIAIPYKGEEKNEIARYILMRGKYLNSPWVGHYQKQ